MADTFEAMRRHLRTSKAKRMIVGAINDPSALGALHAFEEAGRTSACAIMGQNASPEGRAELREAGTRLIGSVAYFPEKYGSEIIAVALGYVCTAGRCRRPSSSSISCSRRRTSTTFTPTTN